MRNEDREHFEMQYREPEDRPSRSCGGWGNYRGPCGAIDCPSCNPGGYSPEEDEEESEEEE